MRKLFLITVDCDIRCDDLQVQRESMEALLEVFDRTDAAGHITWFLNENDFEITKNHEDFLHEALQRGATLGIHDHFEPLAGNYEVPEILQMCRQSRRSVANWLKENGYDVELKLHRNGCLAQYSEIYEALQKLGYTQVSEVYPGDEGPDRAGYHSYDNTDIPPGITPYRHDSHNFAAYTSDSGHFLHFPVMHMSIRDMTPIPDGVEWEAMEKWDEAFERREVRVAPYVWLFHPYEIMNEDRSGIDEELVEHVAGAIVGAQSDYDLTPASTEECREAIENE